MKKEKKNMQRWLVALWRFLCFFLLMAFVISCCMILFLNSVMRVSGIELTRAYIEQAAKLTFLNVVFLSLICSVIDEIRRKFMVDRPVQKIVSAAEQMMQGDFQCVSPGCTVSIQQTDLASLPIILIRWQRNFRG